MVEMIIFGNDLILGDKILECCDNLNFCGSDNDRRFVIFFFYNAPLQFVRNYKKLTKELIIWIK